MTHVQDTLTTCWQPSSLSEWHDILWGTHYWTTAGEASASVLTLPIANCHSGKTDKNEADPEDEDNHEEDCVVFSGGEVEFLPSRVCGIIWE